MILEKKFKNLLDPYAYIGEDVDPFNEYEFMPCSVKLQSGASILTNIAQIDESMCLLFCPFGLEFTYDEYGDTAGFSLIKFIPGSDEIFFLLPLEKIVSCGFMNETCYGTYEKAMNTTLEIPEEDEETTEEKSEEGNVVVFTPKGTIH